MPRSVFWVSVNGTEISSALVPILISMTITDTDGGKSDTLEIELDDEGGQIALPPTNAPIQAGIAYEDDDGTPVGPPVMFEGKVDKPTSSGSRGGGMTLTISAKSADLKGKPKAHHSRHHDKGKLSAAAKKFGQGAGLQVEVASGVDVERDYWAMQGESFLNWGTRIAQEIGATFKVRDGRAIFAERSAGTSLGGQAMPTVRAVRTVAPDGEVGGNIISWQMSPADDRQDWQKFQVRFYDTKDAKYKAKDVEARSKPGSVTHLDRFTRADEGGAEARAKSNSTESDRDKGGGSITINGEPMAQAEGTCVVSGVRPGIDGFYKIKTARHRLSRGSGYQTELELAQPGGSAGIDGRGSASDE